MADVVEKTGKTVELALEEALREMGASRDEITYEILSEPAKGLLGILGIKPAKVRVSRKEVLPTADSESAPLSAETPPTTEQAASPVDNSETTTAAEPPAPTPQATAEDEAGAVACGVSLIQDIFAAMQLEVTVETAKTEVGYVCRLIGDDLGILIGKHGQTLDSLQYLANIAANRQLTGGRVRLILDVGNYRERREDTLRNLARRVADKACRLRQDVRLEPMNRHERKIIHMTLQDNHRVTTSSDGTEPHRFVIVSPRRGKRT